MEGKSVSNVSVKSKFHMKNFKKSSKKNNQGPLKTKTIWHLMLLPAVIFIGIFTYLPMFGLVMAFQDYNPVKGFTGSAWVGLENLKYVFNLPGFYDAVWNTLFISICKMCFNILIPLTLALLLNELRKKWFVRTVQTSIFLPYFLSWVILGGIVLQMFALNGPINDILEKLGLERIMFLLSNDWFPSVVIGTDVWKGMGYNMVIFLAAITGVDQGLYEASRVDGASRWVQCKTITIPAILPVVSLVAVLGLGGLLNAGFDQIFMLYNPIVYESGDIIDTFVYRLGMIDRQYSVSAAVGFFKSIISFILVSISYYTAYKVSDYRIF